MSTKLNHKRARLDMPVAGVLEEAESHPLSYLQEALYCLNDSSAGARRECHTTLVGKVKEGLSPVRAGEAFQSVIEHRPILRTRFLTRAGRTFQSPIADVSCDFLFVDGSQFENDELAERIRSDAKAPFHLECGQVFRARLYATGEGSQTLLLCAHPIVADPASLFLILREFETIYDVLSNGKRPQAPVLGSPFFEHVNRERNMMKEPVPHAGVEFWRSELSGSLPALDLPHEFGRIAGPSSDSWGEVSFSLPSEVTENLEQLSESTGVPLRSVYLTGYAILLSRYANTRRVLVGCSASARKGPGLETVAGNFSNFIALQTECNEDLTAVELIRNISAKHTAIEQHSQVPFALIEQLFGANSSTESGAKCDAYFLWQDLPEIRWTGQKIEILNVSSVQLPPADFDVALEFGGTAGARSASLFFRKDLFETATMERMSCQLVELLHSIGRRPETPVRALNMISSEERDLILGRFAGNSSPYPAACLHELFAEHAKVHPNAEAVVFGAHRLSYGQLDAKSNQVAHFLRAQGVQPGDRVGIFTDRSAHMIVAALGILKAGGAYVPIDPTYPAERLKLIAEDTAVRLVLTELGVKAALPVAAPLIPMDGPNSPIRFSSEGPISSGATPESEAVIIYTSGSTGRPKAACIPHRAVVRTVCATNYVQVAPDDRVAQVASPSFDAAIKEIWLALANGAALIGMRRETLLSYGELIETIKREQITILVLNTAYVHQISREAPHALKGLRKVFFGGEAAEPGPLRTLLNHVGPNVLLNCYGPAEGCVTTTYHPITSIPEAAATVPIGRPVSNARVYILDHQMKPVPLGVPGELYIGGDGVALGYWNRPELNAEHFLPDSFSGRPGGLLYRTRDLARMRANGELVFLGRADDQIKIRGHRIELAEVREALVAHPEVKQAVLLLREDQPGDKRLVAYVTLRRQIPSASEALRDHMRNKLPSYMLPAAFVIVDSIPLNTNGKVDRKALPAPQDRPDLTSVYAAPITSLENRLSDLWKELLRLDTIGTNDNFFDLGGHSLLAARLVTRIEKEFGRQIPVTALYEAPTIGLLANKLQCGEGANSWAPTVELRAASTDASAAPLFCVNWQGSNLGTFRKISSLLTNDRPVYGLQPQALDEAGGHLEKIENIASLYVEEMLKKQAHGPYYLAGICIGGVLAFEMAQQLRARGEEVGLLLLIDSYLPGQPGYLHNRSAFTQYLDNHLGEMLLLPPVERLKYVGRWIMNGGVRVARALGWREPADVAGQRKIARAGTRSVLAYVASAYPGKVTHLICSDGPHRSYEDRRLAWSSISEGGLEIHVIPGNHFTWVEEPNVLAVAHALQTCLDRASGSSHPQHRQAKKEFFQEALKNRANSSKIPRPASGDFSSTILYPRETMAK